MLGIPIMFCYNYPYALCRFFNFNLLSNWKKEFLNNASVVFDNNLSFNADLLLIKKFIIKLSIDKPLDNVNSPTLFRSHLDQKNLAPYTIYDLC